MQEETVKLGGNIELSGFNDIDGASMVILKKIIGNQVKKISKTVENYELLRLVKKNVHNNSKFEVHVLFAYNGNSVSVENIDNNLFMSVSGAMNKIRNTVER